MTLEIRYSMTGTDDPVALTYSVDLDHFSRYAMPDGIEKWEGVGRGNPGHTEDLMKL